MNSLPMLLLVWVVCVEWRLRLGACYVEEATMMLYSDFCCHRHFGRLKLFDREGEEFPL